MKKVWLEWRSFFKRVRHYVKSFFKAVNMLRNRGRYNELRCYRCCYRKSGDPKKLEYCKKQWKGTKTTCEHFRFDKTSLYEKVSIITTY